MTPDEERAYESGGRMAWTQMLQLCIKNLGYEARDRAGWISEREQAVTQLRILCEEFGDNDWPDDLHLADVIEKYLGRHLKK